MQRERLAAEAKRILALSRENRIEMGPASRRMSASAYTDPDRFEREKEHLFRNRPHLVAMSADIPKPDDYLSLVVADKPVFISRGQDGEARAFLNVCQHRAARLLEGRGGCKRIVCPYHGWTYDHDGSLVGLPRRSQVSDDPDHTRKLASIPLLETNGMIFVHPDPNSAQTLDADDVLGTLLPELQSFDFAALNHIAERHELIDMNWKLGNDFVMEGYHVHSLHKNTVGLQSLKGFAHDSYGPHHRLTVGSTSLPELEEIPEAEWDPWPHLTFVYSIFPSAQLTVSKTEVFLQRVEPTHKPGQSRVSLSTFTWDRLDTEENRRLHTEMFEFLYKVQREEDLRTLEGAQQAFESGACTSIVLGRLEPLLIAIHEQIDASLREGATDA
jgi:carnitine monooxygenase subunit